MGGGIEKPSPPGIGKLRLGGGGSWVWFGFGASEALVARRLIGPSVVVIGATRGGGESGRGHVRSMHEFESPGSKKPALLVFFSFKGLFGGH